MRLDAHFGMLPMGAFEHCGNRKIKPQGGGGIPIVSDVVDVVGDVVGGVGDVVGDVVEGIGDAGSWIDDKVNDEIPGGWYTVAAVTGATMGVPTDFGMSGTAGAAGTAGTAGTTGTALSTDAIMSSALKGAGKGAVTGGLTSAVMGGDPLEGALRGAVTGGAGGAAGNAAVQYTGSKLAGGIAGGVAGGGTGALIGGRDPLTGALIGGLTGGTTAGLNEAFGSNFGTDLAPITGELISGIVNGDSGSSLTNTLLGSRRPGTVGNVGVVGGASVNPFDVSSGGIQNLTPTLTKSNQDYQLSGLPHMAAGSSTNQYSFTDLGNKDSAYNPSAVEKFNYIKPGLTQANIRYDLLGLPGYLLGRKEGGSIPKGHNPEFFSEGGLNNRYVKGRGDGTSDSIPAMLASGEFVIPADVVSGLGNGDNDSGAKVLDEFLKTIRRHKRRADVKKLPPDSKGPLGYLLEAKRKVR
jgi:hypothetical protein